MSETKLNKYCHVKCMNKVFNLWESQDGVSRKMPYVKSFTCIAEARKAMIYFIKNPDFKKYVIRIKSAGTNALNSGLVDVGKSPPKTVSKACPDSTYVPARSIRLHAEERQEVVKNE